MYQAQSGSPPPTGMSRVSIPTNQQAASARPTVPLAQGVPQQQQVTAKSPSHFLLADIKKKNVKAKSEGLHVSL